MNSIFLFFVICVFKDYNNLETFVQCNEEKSDMSIVTIVGAGMMGSALAWPLADNGHTVRLVGTPLDEEIISSLQATGVHPRLKRSLPASVIPFSHHNLEEALEGADIVANGVSSFGIPWFVD